VQGAKVPTYYIVHETPADHPAPLESTLPPFKLRSKVRIRDVTAEWDVWTSWSEEAGPLPQRSFKAGSGGGSEAQWTWPDGIRDLRLGEGELGCWDLRAQTSDSGRQMLVPKGKTREFPGLTPTDLSFNRGHARPRRYQRLSFTPDGTGSARRAERDRSRSGSAS
jgi:hypothetical protein